MEGIVAGKDKIGRRVYLILPSELKGSLSRGSSLEGLKKAG